MNDQRPSADDFLKYNEYSFGIEILSRHIKTDGFDKLSLKTQTTILEHYQHMLLSNSFIDRELLGRQATSDKNQSLLKQLLIKRPEQTAVQQQIQQAQYINQSEKIVLPELNPSFEATNWLKGHISYVNSHRLDGVWSRNFTKMTLLYNQVELPMFSEMDSHVNMLNGLTSYGFYMVRGGMELGKLIKHSLSNNDFYVEKQISKLQQFKVQWNLRSPAIINDIILWAPVNAITYHYWLDMKGNILTAILLLGDLLHSLYNYYVFKQRFAYLKNLLLTAPEDIEIQSFIEQLELEHQTQLAKQNYFMGYQFMLLTAFSSICGFFINWAAETQMSFALTGSLVCFAIQFFVNLIDNIFELKATEDPNLRSVIYFKMASRMLVQAAIPSLFLSSSYLLPLLGLNIPAAFVTLSLFALSSFVIKLAADINQLFECWMLEPRATHQLELKQLASTIDANDNTPKTNAKIERWINLYQEDFRQDHAFKNAQLQLQKDGFFALGIMSLLSSGALLVNASLPAYVVLYSTLGALSLVASHYTDLHQVNNDDMLAKLQPSF